MKRRRIGYSILDNEQDKSGATNLRRWRIFRSTLAFALQEVHPLDGVRILWQPELQGQREFVQMIAADLRQKLQARARNIEIQTVPVEFPEPFSLQSCFQVLWDAIETEDAGGVEQFFNLSNGTHTMRLAMYLLARYRLGDSPIHLLQVFRNREISDPVAANTFLARAQPLETGWEQFQPLRKRVQAEKENLLRTISLKRSHHPGVMDLYREIVDVGCFTDDPILLTGPTGSGKSRIAQEIHSGWSGRQGRPKAPFLELNAAGLSGELIRSTLFGHVKGAFTGAVEDRQGFLQAAHRGTLFLDEVGDLDLRSQAELLLAIETGTFFPLGSTEKRRSEFRLICATNKDLGALAASGGFREDLLSRIRCWEFTLPGVRDLPRDFPDNLEFELKDWNLREFRRGRDEPFPVRFETAAKRRFEEFGAGGEAQWPGNFRDLKFSVRRMAVKARLAETPITMAIVEEEIARLRRSWSARGISGAKGEPANLEVLVELVRDRFTDRNLIDGLESLLLEFGMERFGNKAETGRWLYQPPQSKLANPSNRFRERFRSLFSGQKT